MSIPSTGLRVYSFRETSVQIYIIAFDHDVREKTNVFVVLLININFNNCFYLEQLSDFNSKRTSLKSQVGSVSCCGTSNIFTFEFNVYSIRGGF